VTADVSTPCNDTDSVPRLTKDDVRHRVGLADITSHDDIDTLTVRQLKDLLVNNYVDYRGCCEKQELVERVHDLWSDHRKLNLSGKFITFTLTISLVLSYVWFAVVVNVLDSISEVVLCWWMDR